MFRSFVIATCLVGFFFLAGCGRGKLIEKKAIVVKKMKEEEMDLKRRIKRTVWQLELSIDGEDRTSMLRVTEKEFDAQHEGSTVLVRHRAKDSFRA